VKTLELKETKASREITVTHNSVFAAHRLQCRMTLARSTSGILFVRYPLILVIPSQLEESLEVFLDFG